MVGSIPAAPTPPKKGRMGFDRSDAMRDSVGKVPPIESGGSCDMSGFVGGRTPDTTPVERRIESSNSIVKLNK